MGSFGFIDKVWQSAKQEAREVLVTCARASKESDSIIYYSNLVSLIKSIQLEPHDIRLFNLLGEISREEDGDGRGMLSVLVVHKVDGRPGKGFFELAEELGRDILDEEMCWIQERKKVCDYWKSN